MNNNFDNNSLKDLSFAEYAKWWFEEIKKRDLIAKGRKFKTIKQYETDLCDSVRILGSKPIRLIEFLDMQMLVNILAEYHEPRYVEKRYDIAMSVYDDYCDRFDLGGMRRIENFGNKCQKTRLDMKTLNYEDCKIIADAAIAKYSTGTQKNRLGYAIVVLAYGDFYCAEELLGLEWADVDMYNNTINVRHKAVEQRREGGGYDMEIKKSDAPRIMKFSEKVKDALIELYKITGNQKYVMTTSEGNIMLANALRKLYNGALSRAGYNSKDYISTTIGTFCRIRPDWLAENRE